MFIVFPNVAGMVKTFTALLLGESAGNIVGTTTGGSEFFRQTRSGFGIDFEFDNDAAFVREENRDLSVDSFTTSCLQ